MAKTARKPTRKTVVRKPVAKKKPARKTATARKAPKAAKASKAAKRTARKAAPVRKPVKRAAKKASRKATKAFGGFGKQNRKTAKSSKAADAAKAAKATKAAKAALVMKAPRIKKAVKMVRVQRKPPFVAKKAVAKKAVAKKPVAKKALDPKLLAVRHGRRIPTPLEVRAPRPNRPAARTSGSTTAFGLDHPKDIALLCEVTGCTPQKAVEYWLRRDGEFKGDAAQFMSEDFRDFLRDKKDAVGYGTGGIRTRGFAADMADDLSVFAASHGLRYALLICAKGGRIELASMAGIKAPFPTDALSGLRQPQPEQDPLDTAPLSDSSAEAPTAPAAPPTDRLAALRGRTGDRIDAPPSGRVVATSDTAAAAPERSSVLSLADSDRIEAIQRAVAKHHGISRKDIVSDIRNERFMRPRLIAMHLSYVGTSGTMAAIGAAFNRLGSAVDYALKTVAKQMAENAAYAAEVDYIARRAKVVPPERVSGGTPIATQYPAPGGPVSVHSIKKAVSSDVHRTWSGRQKRPTYLTAVHFEIAVYLASRMTLLSPQEIAAAFAVQPGDVSKIISQYDGFVRTDGRVKRIFNAHFKTLNSAVREKDLTPAILDGISRHFGIPADKIVFGAPQSNKKARQVAMYLFAKMTHLTNPEIARRFGSSSHTAVQSAIKSIQNGMTRHEGQRAEIVQLVTEIRSPGGTGAPKTTTAAPPEAPSDTPAPEPQQSLDLPDPVVRAVEPEETTPVETEDAVESHEAFPAETEEPIGPEETTEVTEAAAPTQDERTLDPVDSGAAVDAAAETEEATEAVEAPADEIAADAGAVAQPLLDIFAPDPPVPAAVPGTTAAVIPAPPKVPAPAAPAVRKTPVQETAVLPPGPERVDEIRLAVAARFAVSAERLASRSQDNDLKMPRQVGMYLAATILRLSSPEIGRHFGVADQHIVDHHVRRVKRLIRQDFDLADVVAKLRHALTDGAPAPTEDEEEATDLVGDVLSRG